MLAQIVRNVLPLRIVCHRRSKAGLAFHDVKRSRDAIGGSGSGGHSDPGGMTRVQRFGHGI